MDKKAYNIIKSFNEEYKESKIKLAHMVKKLVLTAFNEKNEFSVKVNLTRPVMFPIAHKTPIFTMTIVNAKTIEVFGRDNPNNDIKPTDDESVKNAYTALYDANGKYVDELECLPIEAVREIVDELRKMLTEKKDKTE